MIMLNNDESGANGTYIIITEFFMLWIELRNSFFEVQAEIRNSSL